MMCNSVFRLRPIEDYTLDELENKYLWFSQRAGFKDKYDANIGAFIQDSPQLVKGFETIYEPEEYEKFKVLMDKTGICCFTKTLPSRNNLRHFPNGNNSICVEYFKDLLEDYFLNNYYMKHPFNDVSYLINPTKLEGGDYHVLLREMEDGKIYESVYTVFRDPRRMHELIIKLLTTLGKRFIRQNETRIILGIRNIPDEDMGNGYKIPIPDNAINRIIIYPNTNEGFVERIKQINHLRDKVFLCD